MRMKLYFVVPSSKKIWGSTFLRGFQLYETAEKHLSKKYDTQILRMPLREGRGLRWRTSTLAQIIWAQKCPRDAIYFVTKQCIANLYPYAAEVLQRRAAGVLFDYVDSDMSKVSMRGADIHLCASYAHFLSCYVPQGEMKEAHFEILHHNYDSRLTMITNRAKNQLRTIYWGATENLYLPAALQGKVSVLESKVSESTSALSALQNYNMHYAIRPRRAVSTYTFKPFTKGANAAACGANIIVDRDATDAQYFLGGDYPYFVNSDDDEDIIAKITEARYEFGGDNWMMAERRMEGVKLQLSPERISAKLDKIISRFTS